MMLLSALSSVQASVFFNNRLQFTTINDSQCYVSGCHDIYGNVVVPEVAENEGLLYQVVSIGDEAFSNCRDLLSITIPNSVITIGHYAFSDCLKLKNRYYP